MANYNDWGLTEHGFRRPSYIEILDAYEYQAKERFTQNGKTPNLTVRSPLGIFLRIFAWMVNLLFMVIEDVYNSQFVDTAVGASLYQLGKNIGMKLLPAQRAGGSVQVSGSPGVIVPEGFLVGTVAGIQYAVVAAATIPPAGIVSVPIQCTEFGTSGNLAANKITEIITPIPGIDSVTNEKPVDGGRGRETDEQFRDRYYRSVDLAGGVNADAIQAEIRQSVEGVLAVKVYENETDFDDIRGLPPHSIEAVVYSGLDVDIAQAIYKRKGAGIQTYGNTMVGITSKQNNQLYEIRFTRPAGIPVWLRIENLKVDGELFPPDGIEQIRKALITYIGSDISGGLNIGKDVIYNSLPCRILSVSGVIDFDLLVSQDGASYDTNNIFISERQKAVANTEKISISLEA